jgi:UDP-3-O-[3-hydroxymyristoyl] glucosamine N-acyltransferase
MKQSLAALAEKLDCRLMGNGSVSVTRVSSLKSADANSLVFVDDAKHFDSAMASAAAAIVAGSFAADSPAGKPILISSQPRLAFSRAAKLLHDSAAQARGIHPSAIVAASVIGSNVEIGPRAVVGEQVKIGDGSTLGAGCVIGDGVEIGAHCRIDANVAIYAGVTLGNRVVVQAGVVLGSDGFGYVRDEQTGRYEQSPQIGRLVIEDDVEIGANSTIDRGALDETRIRRGTKIDNLVHIGHNCQIGENVVIAAQTGLSGSVTIENNVVMGGQVGVGDHARIESGAMLGGQCGILPKKVLRGKGIVFWGTPARPVKEYLKELAFLSRSAKKSR